VIHDLGTLPGGTYSSAYGINNSGQVAGVSNAAGSSDHAVLWDEGSIQDLLPQPYVTAGISRAYGINNKGQVVGVASFSFRLDHAFLWSNGTRQAIGGTLAGELRSYAYGINDAGEVVGESGNGFPYAFFWRKGVIKNLGTLPGGTNSVARGIAERAHLILYHTFNSLAPFFKRIGYGEVAVKPEIGPEGVIRYWWPGEYSHGATVAGHLEVTPNGKRNPDDDEGEVHNEDGHFEVKANGRLSRAVDFPYSGSLNGSCTQDTVAYPVGPLMDPGDGAIDFWYKPHYNSNDPSAVMWLLDGFKSRIDLPYDVYSERAWSNETLLWITWQGWSGRKYFTAVLGEQAHPDAWNYLIELRTPGEFDTNGIRFKAEQWMHIALFWKSDGMSFYNNKTMALFINGREVASTTQRFAPKYPFQKYLNLGAQQACPFQLSGPQVCYSGASGVIDDFRIWSSAGAARSIRGHQD
jgi:probable HAF family extracellular repeat protein